MIWPFWSVMISGCGCGILVVAFNGPGLGDYTPPRVLRI